MDAIATGIPLTEPPVTSGKHAAKTDKPKDSFADLLQERFVPSTVETTNLETLSGADKKTMMKMLHCGHAEQKKQEQEKEMTIPARFAPLAYADPLEMIKAMVSQIQTDEGVQDDAPIALDQERLQHVFSQLTMINDQLDDPNDSAIETIVSAFLQGVEKTTETTDENVQRDDKWFDVLQTEILDVSEQDVSNLLNGLFNEVNAAKIEPGQLLNLTKLMTIFEAHLPEQQQNMITAQTERIIDQVKSQKHVDKAAEPLLKLLEAWSSLAEAGQQSHKQADAEILEKTNSMTRQQQPVWQKHSQLDQQWNRVMRHPRNPVDTKVMSEGVKNILMNAQKYSDDDKHTVHASQPSSTMGISKIEQFVIHLQQQANSQTVDQQLIDQFQKAMKTSKFFTGNNGSTQLHITLKPENLGEMMVKLTQVNGEMTVKITVSAQATKDMLESNIHQLKHLFSPNQVIIEKHDLNVAEAQGFTNERGDQSMQKQEQEEHDSQQENQQQDQQEEENDTSFQDWLMNEKV